jgi:hypothetical protein
MSLRPIVVALGVVTVLSASIASATTLTFARSQTLGGWNERVFTSEWTDLAPDALNLVTIDGNGDLRGFDHPTSTVWLSSPPFVLEPGPITISQMYLMASAAAAPTSAASISPTKSASGWGGVALRNGDGNFVLTYDQPTSWSSVVLSATQLQPFVGQTLTLDLINTNNSSGDFLYVNRPITVEGTLVAVPEPSTAWMALGGLAWCGIAACRTWRRSGAEARAAACKDSPANGTSLSIARLVSGS